MENILYEIFTILNNSSIAWLLLPLVATLITLSKSKDILDFANIQKDDLLYTLAKHLIKSAIPDTENIIKVEYQLSNEIKSQWQKMAKILYKDNLAANIDSKKYEIPIRMLCLQKDDIDVWTKDIRNIKIGTEKLGEVYAEILKIQLQKGILSSQKAENSSLYTVWKQKRPTLLLNAGLYNAFARKFLSTIQMKEIKETVSDTLIGIMIDGKAKAYTRSYIYLSLTIFLLFLGSILTDIKVEPFLIYTNIFFLAATLINQKILEFRIVKGYYGSNEYEAREMIRFIAENSDGSNFSDGIGLKPFPAEDIPKSVWVEGCVIV